MDVDEKSFLDDLEEQQFNCDVQNELSLYRGTGDARFFWRALALFVEAGKPLPKPFLDKLVDWAGCVQHLHEPGELAAALELSGDKRQKIGPKHSAAFEKRWRLASEVLTVKKLRPSLSLQDAFAVVARNRSLTTAKVKKAYHDTFTAGRNSGNEKGTDLASVIARWR